MSLQTVNSNGSYNNSRLGEFVPLDLSNTNVFSDVQKILKERLPRSCHVYNMAIGYPKWADRHKFHWLKISGEMCLTVDSWIVVKSYREDRGQDINISPPKDPVTTPEIELTFAEGKLIDWKKAYLFPAVDRSISRMIVEISAFIKGNVTRIAPCYLYFMETSHARPLQIQNSSQNIEIKALDPIEGVKFLLTQWKYATDGTQEYLQEILKVNQSMGIYFAGEPVCGVVTHANGIMGMLNTAEAHRHKGFAQICMKALMKCLGEEGILPCSAAEVNNEPSIKLHEKLGMSVSHLVDYIRWEG